MPDPLSDLQRLGQEFDADVVEAVARTIWAGEPNVGQWCDWADLLDDPEHEANLKLADGYRRLARAAIAAARPMIEAEAFERAEKACKDQAGKLYARLKKNPHWSEHDVAVFESAISEANELAETIAALIEPQS